MDRPYINVVWLKRDLRSKDHLPWAEAEKSDLPYLLIFLWEPNLMAHPDTSDRHLQFQAGSLHHLNASLKSRGLKIESFYGDAPDVFAWLTERYQIKNVWSYQESGTNLTCERDKTMDAFFRSHHIIWKQFQRDGIIRGIQNRNGWDERWLSAMTSQLVHPEFRQRDSMECDHPFVLPAAFQERLQATPADFPTPGEDAGLRLLEEFLNKKARNYAKDISSPEKSALTCSLLSPYLAWGNLSNRQVYQACSNALSGGNRGSLGFFMARLQWRCHFIQKFEMACHYETQCINRDMKKLHGEKMKTD